MRENEWQNVKEIFLSALERPPGERARFVAENCGGKTEIIEEVESLLASYDADTEFIETPAANLSSILPSEATINAGNTVGNYKIVREIGAGGMGAVFLAERDDGEFRREVAVKIIRQTLADSELVNRFKRERQILASLNHPNIAHLLDGGIMQDGSPFLAMEYVEGQPITDFAELQDLTVEEKLRLFLRVCAAVSYAHQNLVVHRDLKPSNIFVAVDGTPKLLDFGLAKMLDGSLDANSRNTQTAFRALTPAYASPEQLKGEPITTASDIYSLGIVLYELLTGTHPFHFKNHSLEEAIRVVCDTEPARPSAAVSFRQNEKLRITNYELQETTKGIRQAETGNQNSPPEDQKTNPKSKIQNPKSLRGDLDNIILKSLRKEPERRYKTVQEFAEDIERHLGGLPVRARPNTFSYRTEKFIKRNRWGAIAGLLILLTLLGGVAATIWQARRAEAQKVRAEKRFNDVRKLSDSLLFEIHDSVKDLQGSTPTRQLIVSRALEYLDGLAQEAGDDSSLLLELAAAYEKIGDIQGNPYSANLGDTEGALASYRKAIAIRKTVNDTQTNVETLMAMGRSYRSLGDILEQKGEIAECLDNYRRSLSIFEELAAANPTDFSVRDELARAYETLGDGFSRTENKTERLENYRKALAIRLRLLEQNKGDAKLRRGAAIGFLKVGGAIESNKTEAVENLQKGIEIFEALSAAEPTNARARREIGFAYYQSGKVLTAYSDYPAALESRRKAFIIRQEIATQDPKNSQAQFDLAAAFGDLSESYTQTNSPVQGIEQGLKCLETLEKLSTNDPTNAINLRNVGLCYERLGEAQSKLAAGEHANNTQAIKDWTKAREWYQKARETFSELQNRNALMPADAGQTEKFAAKVTECQNAIERLNNSLK